MSLPDPPSQPQSGLGWCAGAMVMAAFVLAIGNADSARSWAEGLRPTPWTQPVRETAERWAGFTRSAGLSRVRDSLRGVWEHRHDLGWTLAQQPAKKSAAAS